MYHHRIILAASLLVLAMCSQASIAQPNLNCTEPNLLVLAFPSGEISQSGVPPYSQVQVDLFLINPSAPAICGIEFYLPNPENGLILDIEWVVDVIDIGTDGHHIVGFSGPTVPVDNAIHLATVLILYTDTNGAPMELFLGPSEPASIPGTMAALNCVTEEVFPVFPVSLDFEAPVAAVNPQEPLAYCLPIGDFPMWVNISTEGDPDNLAATHPEASDGYDAGFDLPDSDPERQLFFPHEEWGLGGHFAQDVAGTFDPAIRSNQWVFAYQAPVGSNYPTMVELDFQSNLELAEGQPAYIRDLTSGETVDLHAEAGYQFTVTHFGQINYFELVIGNNESDYFSFNVDAFLGGYTDVGNLGGSDPTASDGFDSQHDEPEPAPPPQEFLSAYFHHPQWPLGDRYRVDIRGQFDPQEESRTWPFVVETDMEGLITLDFTSDFGEHEGVPFFLEEIESGQIVDLRLTPTYSFPSPLNGIFREFEIRVGGAELEPPPYQISSRFIEAGWAMAGLPLQPYAPQNTIGQVILDQAPGTTYVFGYQQNQEYVSLSADILATQDQGYWIATTEDFTWTMDGQQVLDVMDIPLNMGWNLVGHPLWFNGQISGLRVVNQESIFSWDEAVDLGWVSSGVWSYAPINGSYFTTETLRPWFGYWFRANLEGLALQFHWPNFVYGANKCNNADGLDQPPLPPHQYWKTQLTVTDELGRSDSVVLGVHPEASGGYDRLYDLAHPPLGPDGGPRISSFHPGWESLSGVFYSRDFLSPGHKTNWTTLLEPAGSASLTLSWDRIKWPAGHDLQLYLPDQNRVLVLSMAEQNSITLEMGHQPMEILVRNPDFNSPVDDFPGIGYNLSVHPNPFNPACTLSFDLPRPGEVEVRIFSVRGLLVDRINAGPMLAGHQEVVWRGQDRFGRSVPSGSYFSRLYLEGEAVGQVKKMVLLR